MLLAFYTTFMILFHGIPVNYYSQFCQDVEDVIAKIYDEVEIFWAEASVLILFEEPIAKGPD